MIASLYRKQASANACASYGSLDLNNHIVNPILRNEIIQMIKHTEVHAKVVIVSAW